MVEKWKQINPVERSLAASRIYYDRLSRWYEFITILEESRFRQIYLDILAAKPGETILEIGPGPGHALIALSQSVGRDGRIVGLDISPKMLKIAKSKYSEENLSGMEKLVWGDGTSLPFASGRTNAILMSFTLELFDIPGMINLLEECQRVLVKDGRICLVSLAKKDKPGMFSRLYEWIQRKFPRILDCRPIYVQDTIESAGFKIDKSVEMSTWGLPIAIVFCSPKHDQVNG
jgi:ubiquinone/menaquinone biosynthesis C-methylase UbiE